MDYSGSFPATGDAAPARSSAPARALQMAIPIFAVAIFTGSSLLFLVQPMFAKMLLPRLGGSSSVWNTCVLFFQTILLLGYVYAHVSTKWLGVRRQAVLHLGVLALPFIVLPLSAGTASPSSSDSPVLWLLATMAVTVGLPFFVVSTSAPLLQRWFATFPLPSARDPYFLYSASNLGSMIALLGYPFLLEPAIGVRSQTMVWTAGYAVLVLLTAGCAWMVRECGRGSARSDADVLLDMRRGSTRSDADVLLDVRRGSTRIGADFSNEGRGSTRISRSGDADPRGSSRIGDEAVGVSAGRRMQWVALSFVPSSLMLGVTTHVSSDIAAVPLMWVLPLAMYLLTFVLAFAQREIVPRQLLIRALPPLVFASLLTVLIGVHHGWLIPLHLATFFCAALLCHRELADRRPHVAHLTEFYIWMSLGGMFGGIFNTLVAPQIFATILEYPLVLAAAALLRPAPATRKKPEPMIVVIAVAAIVLACGTYLILGTPAPETTGKLLATMAGLSLPIVFARRARAFGIVAMAFVIVISLGRPSSAGRVLFVGRSFFGMHKVIEASDGTYRTLQHGSTVHGRQQLTGASDCEPTSYYVPASPIGQLFRSRMDRVDTVGIIGLGSGGLACYAQAGERWTFYEIDPLVDSIAKNPSYFTQLRNSQGAIEVVLGDGRITLQGAPSASYDLIILDAFSSDAIPLHLLTREALHLYLSRLAPGGVIALHISNRYLNLEPMLGALIRQEGLSALARVDSAIPPEDLAKGRLGSHWVMIARDAAPLARLDGPSGWRAPAVNAHVKPWSDDYSNILSVLTYSRR